MSINNSETNTNGQPMAEDKNEPLEEGKRLHGLKRAGQSIARDLPVLPLTAGGAAVIGGLTLNNDPVVGAGLGLGLGAAAGATAIGAEAVREYRRGKAEYERGEVDDERDGESFIERSGLGAAARAQKQRKEAPSNVVNLDSFRRRGGLAEAFKAGKVTALTEYFDKEFRAEIKRKLINEKLLPVTPAKVEVIKEELKPAPTGHLFEALNDENDFKARIKKRLHENAKFLVKKFDRELRESPEFWDNLLARHNNEDQDKWSFHKMKGTTVVHKGNDVAGKIRYLMPENKFEAHSYSGDHVAECGVHDQHDEALDAIIDHHQKCDEVAGKKICEETEEINEQIGSVPRKPLLGRLFGRRPPKQGQPGNRQEPYFKETLRSEPNFDEKKKEEPVEKKQAAAPDSSNDNDPNGPKRRPRIRSTTVERVNKIRSGPATPIHEKPKA